MVRQVAMTRDERDATKWHLAEDVALGGLHAGDGRGPVGDGTSEPLSGSMFASSTPINTIFL